MARNKYPEQTVKLILDQALKLFIEKGYESTSIQDIINHLGGLSKGAIYHHFKSKEDIFGEVCKALGKKSEHYYNTIRDDKTKTGSEKLRMMFQAAYANPSNDALIAMTNKILSDPKFFMNELEEMYEDVVPRYIQPIIEQGVADGSIQTTHPKELAEVVITLLNVWINPIISKSTPEQAKSKLVFLNQLLQGVGIYVIDTEMIEQYGLLCERFNAVKK